VARSDARHPRPGPGSRRRGRKRRLVLVPVLLLLVALVASGAVAWQSGRLGPYIERLRTNDGPAGPAAVAPPPGLDLPALSAPSPVAAPVGATGEVLPGAVRRAVAAYLRDADLGPHVLAVVTDAVTGEEVFRKGKGAAVPASTTKLVTAAAALQSIGPETTFGTRVVSGGPGTIVLVGGGDPFLERAPADPAEPDAAPYPPRADLTTLANRTATALFAVGTTQVQLGYDASLFTGPAVNPAWPADYVPDAVVSPISALWVDEGRPAEGLGRVGDPALAAAQDFAAALTAAGVTVTGAPVPGVAAPTGAELASVRSAPLREIVQRVLEASDNEGAEVLARQVAIARGLPGSSVDAATAVTTTLGELGVPTTGITVYDGSGLSRQNRIEPAALTALLRTAADPAYPRLDTLLPGLPVAGFTGSLTDRFAAAAPQGRGTVHAKTGTLTGVTALAGTVVDVAGHPYFFAMVADQVRPPDETDARDALDGAAAALGACTCSR
jgi:D-alanyl-D-alanine carboxypeptidase/D-alanyl-D-alanine-endopeptidase (penicillin-binding protein 4)